MLISSLFSSFRTGCRVCVLARGGETNGMDVVRGPGFLGGFILMGSH